MSRRPIQHETLADLLCLESVDVRCHGCGRRRLVAPTSLFERLQNCDWATPLHDAGRYLRCRDCDHRGAQILIPRPRAPQHSLRLVEAREKRPWERYDEDRRRGMVRR